MTLRAKLTLAFALFGALPMLAAIWPVSRALSRSLEAEHAARLDTATHAVEGELRRLATLAAEAARDVARSPEAEALARDRAQGLVDPAEAAGRAAEWMEARGLEVLAVTDAAAVVLSSGHLPGRAGDVDPELASLYASAPPSRAVPRLVTRATPAGLEPLLAFLAWEPVPGEGERRAGAEPDPALRVVAGMALGPRAADRLASLTGGDVSIVAEGADRPMAASAPRGGALGRLATRLLWAPRVRARSLPLPATGPPVARVEVALSAAGLERTELQVALVFLSALGISAAAALLLGHLLARRITRPLEALRAGARQVAGGDLRARVLVPAAGEVRELVAAFNAMTADLAASRERAAAAERVAAWREVARRLAHEIKNPLTPIAMSVETLRDALEHGRPDFKEIFAEGTAAIQEEVRRLKRIVDEFSRFARMPPPEPAPAAAGDLVDALLALYPAPPPGIRLVREVQDGLPPVAVDRDQILQVLLNLARNAVEAMPGGGEVRIGACRREGEVLISVSDTGPGIPPESLPSIFEPYFTTKEGGTGLGLAIADRIVQEHGGRLEVASPPGQGATFTVRLPVIAPASP